MIDWISLAKEIHGDTYDYTNATVKNSKITYLCKEHGVITQTVSQHVRNKAQCRECWVDGLNGKLNICNKDAIKMLEEKHGCRYDYSLVDYKGNKESIKIVCPLHGIFEQRFDHHRSGSHCQDCANEVRRNHLLMDAEDFIRRSKVIHGADYNYYSNSTMSRNGKVTIFCISCQKDFLQNPQAHLEGHGCSACNRGEIIGFKKSKFIEIANNKNKGNACFYILKCFNDTECFYKVGVTTNDIATRFQSSKMPYEYKIIKEVITEAEDVWNMEKKYIKDNKGYQYTPLIPFSGYIKECFTKLKFID